ncbi:MAG TPA: prolipoprotein diacylglyceryl transferase family protein [Gemmatimonadaceae bacterium]|nr:prolipoprotein diacylglyceryl transferase family protein [Gemmatimonadaceae bacterium]
MPAERVGGKVAYGALFALVLPAALATWAARLDGMLPLRTPGWPRLGAAGAAAGLALMAAAVATLWREGHGLPMSPYPPERFATGGPYRVIRHPMYLGALLVSGGLSLALRSPAGVWLVTPLLAGMIAAWVLGWERDETVARFGAAVREPLLHLPRAADVPPDGWERLSAHVLVIVPWLVLHEAVRHLGAPAGVPSAWLAWDRALPVVPWTEAIRLLAVLVVLFAPFVARTRRDLRWLMTRGWLAMAMVLPLALLLPVVSEVKPVAGEGAWQTVMRWEHAVNGTRAMLPGALTVWVLLAARVLQRRWPVLSGVWVMVAGAAAVSGVTTGMQPALDVVAGFAVTWVVVHAERLWARVRRRAEQVANSWRETTIGGVRFLSHGAYAALGVWLGLLVACALAGDTPLAIVLAVAAAAIVGAALWAQVVEGSSQLLRPYGYYGAMVGGGIALLASAAFGVDAWQLAGAFAVGGAVTQAIGRLRCLVQGCCHGARCAAWLGIRYDHPRSRVNRLTPFGHRPLHPTPVYSMGWMLLVAAALARLWTRHASLELIVGLYFILTGLGRFAEEHYRGEPQTVVWRGLRLYQWLAILFVVVGAGLASAGWSPIPAPILPTLMDLVAITAFGLLVYVAYGVDFPRLHARFSRLV